MQGTALQRDEIGGQAANFLAGLTAGILTLSLRKEFGDVVPVLAVETGERFGEARIRAGFEATSALRDVLPDIVRSVYIEGFVGTSGDTVAGGGNGSAGVTGGVSLELAFPNDVFGAFTFVPPNSGGFDLLWEP